MKEIRRLGLHLLLLVIAATAAFIQAQPEDEATRPLEPGEVQLWAGSHKDVTMVTYVGKNKKIVLEQKKDDVGLWYVGKVEPVEEKEEPKEEPDAGPPKRKPPKPKPVEAATFVSVSLAETIAKKLAPMRAKRAIGEVSEDKLEPFGLHEPKGTLTLVVAGKTHELIIGGPTPGRGHVYARYTKDNQVYVIDTAISRDLDGGAGRLMERQQHGWRPAEAERATIAASDHRREVVRSGTEGRRFWAGPSTLDVNDEIVANWLKKVDRLRPVKYLEALPQDATLVMRVDFSDKRERIGFVELHHSKTDDAKYFLLTENLRMPTTVSKTVAEQVRDDLPSLFPDMPQPEKDEEPADDKDAGAPNKSEQPDGHGHGPGDGHGHGPPGKPPAPKPPTPKPPVPPLPGPPKGPPKPPQPPKK